jgi:CheY-like chemotaxis protein
MNLRKDIAILIAEDDRGHYVLTKSCLRNAGIENDIKWLEDGQTTLDYLTGDGHPSKTGKKYILLLDIRMPKIDGVQVLREVKDDEQLKDMPVIMLTTSQDQQLAQLCYELGCEAHIIKPPGKVLLSAIERLGQRI